MQSRFDIPSIVVSHDPAEIGLFSDHVWLMQDGAIAGSGLPEDVFLRPESAAVALLTGVENVWHGRCIAQVNGQAQIAIGAMALTGEYGGSVGDAVTVALPAGEVLLSRAIPSSTSARNVWLARITRVKVHGREVVVHAGCRPAGLRTDAGGEVTPLLVIVTPGAASDLDLKAGDTLYAVFKAGAAAVYASG